MIRDSDIQHLTNLTSEQTANYASQQTIVILTIGVIILFIFIGLAAYWAGHSSATYKVVKHAHELWMKEQGKDEKQ